MKGMKGKCTTCMGRKVEYHSPAKHPEQGDAMSAEEMDRMTEEAARKQGGTYQQMRKDMRPMQREMPRDTGQGGGVLEYMKRMLPGGKSK